MVSKENVRKTFLMDQDYDAQNDTLFLYIDDDYDYKKSVRMNKDVILDLDQKDLPVALEILHASKVFNVNKFFLTQPVGIDMQIEVEKDIITLEATFLVQIRQKEEPKPVKAQAANRLNLPVQDLHFATA